jgi:hypothetical protein
VVKAGTLPVQGVASAARRQRDLLRLRLLLLLRTCFCFSIVWVM